MTKKQKKNLYRILISLIIVIVLTLVNDKLTELQLALIYLIPYLIIGYDILIKAFKGIIKKQVFDENFLMAVATVGAYALKDFREAVAVMLFYQIGEWFQSYAVGKSRKNIAELMNIRPDYANIELNGKISKVDPEAVAIGQTIVVYPGEKIPLDGVVIEGSSAINTSSLTGESLPRDVEVDDGIISGCINLSGVIKVKTTKEFGESTVSKVLNLVENASNLKSKSEDFITRFARYYTPIVCYSALMLAVLPPVINLIIGQEANFYDWLYRALTFLVISCPCALVISIPLSFFAGIGAASRQGILVKGSNYLEALSNIDCLVFDKTGTITKGVFEVNAIHNDEGYNADKLLEYAAYSEIYSSHPIGKSIKKAYGKEIDASRISDIKEIAGYGVTCKIDGVDVAVGNDKLMAQLNIGYHECELVGTIIHVAISGKYYGHLVISDIVKNNAKQAIEGLHAAGIKQTIMLTGDNDKIAQAVAKELGIDELHSQLLPQDKVVKMEQILANRKDKVGFVGDGINDAPVLTRADVGIAMGALGSDAAIEAADVVLMDDDLSKIVKAIKISRMCGRIVKENIYFAIGIKVAFLVLAGFGITNMWAAIFADVGVMILAVINAIRLLLIRE